MTCLGGCVHRHIERWLLFSLCRHMSLCSHCESKVVANGEYPNGLLCSEKFILWCWSLFLGQCIGIIALLKSELSPWIFQHKHKPISEGFCWAADHVCILSFHTSCSYHLRCLGKTHALEKVHVLYSLFLRAILSTPVSALLPWLRQSSFAGNWWSDFFYTHFRLIFI